MNNVSRAFILLAGLLLALIPAAIATAQPQYSSSPPDTLSFWQTGYAIDNASKYAVAIHSITWTPRWSGPGTPQYSIKPRSFVYSPESLEFDVVNQKGGTKHLHIDVKNLEKVWAACGKQWCQLIPAAGKISIQDKEGVLYDLWFGLGPSAGVNACQRAENNAECMHAAYWFAAALNGLHARVISHWAGLNDFHQQAAAWRALTTKPPLAEGARILRLAAEDAIKRQNPAEALIDFELGVQADPTWAQGWFNAALLAGELGFYFDATAHMQNYLELLPDAPDAKSARDQIDLWKYKAGQSPAGK